MITVHHLNNSRSQRVLWLLEELDLDYEVIRYERNPVTMRAPESLLRVHPLGKSPVVTYDGKTLAETGAIVEYVIEQFAHGKLVPATGTDEHLRYRYWLHYAEGSAMPPLLLKLVFDRMASGRTAPILLRPLLRMIATRVLTTQIDPQLALHMNYWEAELAGTGWFAGPEFSAADIQMSFPVEAAASRVGLDARPRLREFLNRIHTRPAYHRALERGGPYELLS
jgi:glutathione S-transferase